MGVVKVVYRVGGAARGIRESVKGLKVALRCVNSQNNEELL